MQKTVMAWRSTPKVERVQDRARDNYQRFLGLQVTTYECDLAPAGPVPALRQGLFNLVPGRYFAAQVIALRNGAPFHSGRGCELKLFPDAAQRDKYIADRKTAYSRRVTACTSTSGR